MAELVDELKGLVLDHKQSTEGISTKATTPSPTLESVLSIYPIWDQFCSNLDIAGILPFTHLSKHFSTSAKAQLKKRWDINRRLWRFVHDPLKLRRMMRKNEAVISGSFALQFIDDVLWTESDLDIWVPGSDGKDVAMHRYLVWEEEYQLQSVDSTAPHQDYVSETKTYRRKKDGIETQAQLIITANESPTQVILYGFYMTAILNIITWNKACSLFPLATFIARKSVQLNSSRFEAGIKKYTSRGWEMVEITKEFEDLFTWTSRNHRYVGDSRTLKISFDTTGIDASSYPPDYVVENAHFNIVNRAAGLEIDVMRYAICVLKYTYTSSNDGEDDFWMVFMGKRLDRLVRNELNKLTPEERAVTIPIGITEDFSNHASDFDKPASWTHYDHLVCEWVQEWEEWKKMDEVPKAEYLKKIDAEAVDDLPPPVASVEEVTG